MPQTPAEIAAQFGGKQVSEIAAQFGGKPVDDSGQQAPQLQIAQGTKPQDAIQQMRAYNQSQGLEGQPRPSALDSALLFGKGVAEQLNPIEMVKGLYGAVTSPWETVKGLTAAQAEQFQKGKAAYDQGRYSEAFGHTVAGALPLVGPAAANVGENIGQGNVAEGLGQTVGLAGTVALPSVARSAAKAASTVLKSGNAGERLATIGERIAQDKFVKAVAPQVGQNKVRLGNVAAKVAPQVLREPGMGAASRAGLLDKVAAKLEAAESGLDEAAAARSATELIDTGPVIEELKSKLSKITAESAAGPDAHAQVKKLGLDMPAASPAPFTKFADLPVPYKQEARRVLAEMEEFGYQDRQYLNRSQEVARESGNGGFRGTRARMQKNAIDEEKPFIEASGGTPIYQEILQGKTGTTRNAMIMSLKKYIDGQGTPTPIAHRMISIIDKRLRNPEAVSSARLPPEAGFNIDDVSGALGKDRIPEPRRPQAMAIAKAIDEIQSLGPAATYESLRKIRQGWDEAAKARYSPAVTQDYMRLAGESKGAADVTDTIRNVLAMVDPASAKANAQYSLWRKMHDVLQAAEETDRVRPTVGRKIAARIAGAAVGAETGGGAGAVLGAVLAPMLDTGMIGSPTTKIMTARALTQLSDALRKGNVDLATAHLKQLRRLSLMGQTRPQSQESE